MLRCFLHVPQANVDPNFIFVPYLWLQLKQYYEQTSPHASKWEWIEPEIYPHTVDQLMEELSAYDSLDVLGISHYVWSREDTLHDLCKRVKQRFPSCVVVFGGPQPNVKYSFDYFRKHSHVDAVCDQESYGEWFWTGLLDQIAQGTLDFSTVPHAVYPNTLRMKVSSTVVKDKRAFTWAINPFGNNTQYLDKLFEYARQHSLSVKASIEFSRGCPYTCTYCDWGGGIGTKVIFRPIEYVFQDLEQIMKYDVLVLDLIDANLGIVARDVDIFKKIVELRDQYNKPEFHVTVLGFAKTNKRYVNQLLMIGAESGILHEHFISAQSLNEKTLRAIRRTDVSWNQQFHDLQPLRVAYPDFPVYLQVILGLPESTLDEFYTLVDTLYEYNVSLVAAMWSLLPAAPAYHPEYVSKYQLTVRPVRSYMQSLQRRISRKDIDLTGVIDYPVVVQSSTYSQTEWEEMFLLSMLIPAVFEVKWFNQIMVKLHTQTELPFSTLYRSFVVQVLKEPRSPLHVWYTTFIGQLRGSTEGAPGCMIDAHTLPIDNGFAYAADAYWVEMMCSAPEWSTVVRAWVASVTHTAQRLLTK
jgi:putative methyltransferase